MKKIIKFISISLISLVSFVACEPDPDVPLTHLIINQEIVEPLYNSVELTCDFTSNFTIDYVCAHVSLTPEFSQVVNKASLVLVPGGVYNGEIDGLEENTTYYIHYEIMNSRSSYIHDQVTDFQTFSRNMPAVITKCVTDISLGGAKVDGAIKSDGGYAITERGVCYSKVANPTISDEKIVSGSGKGDFSCYLLYLEEGTTYYVRSYAINEKGVYYGRAIQFTTLARTFHEGHEYIDLGLSVYWAIENLGESLPEKSGDYYAWGETEPKEVYEWSTYKWCNGSQNTLTKYCTKREYGAVDKKITLELEDDAAHVNVNWGGDWRMPTSKELNELCKNCKWEREAQGYRVTSNINGKSIFLAMGGYMKGDTIFEPGKHAYYWTSTLSDDPSLVHVLYFNNDGYIDVTRHPRNYGYFIRPVYPK